MAVFIIVTIFLFVDVASGCGITTHIEIGHRASEYFHDSRGSIDYKQLILDNQDAFQAGNPYPDAYYDSICQGGKFHDVSEDTHWAPFLKTTVEYIRQQYPQPWNEDARKLVVFLLGFASHQVADVSWHSLGIDQGFLTTMGDINFFGSFPAAHGVGDVGGDVLSQAELELDYISTLSNWYIPVKDLYEIYKMYYNNTVIVQEHVIIECTSILFLARLGEKIALSKLYDDYSAKSPFMVEEFESYFLGGVDDMASWTQRVWHDTIDMLENGTGVCDVPKNPIYINCSRGMPSKAEDTQMSGRWNASWRGLRSKINLRGLDIHDVKVTPSARGVRLSPADPLKALLRSAIGKSPWRRNESVDQLRANEKQPISTLHVGNNYARLGWSMTAADLDGDENEDLIIAAPGYGKPGQAQLGRVYVVYGTNQVLANGSHDLDREADVILQGFYPGGKFGSAVAALDLNLDGYVDIAVSAPSVGSERLTYTGEVYVFYGSTKGLFHPVPDVTITCTLKYCNLGSSLSAGDYNLDGHLDLLIGSPYAPNKSFQQAGMVSILYAGLNFKSSSTIYLNENDMNSTYKGDQEYAWFGHKTLMHSKLGLQPFLMNSQPTYRICANQNCYYSPEDKQSVGALNFHATARQPFFGSIQMMGSSSLEKFGAGFAVGDPFGNGSFVLAVGSNTKDVEGTVVDVATRFSEAGQVKLFHSPTNSIPIATYQGDRKFGRFGGEIMFADVTGDGIDDLVISAPFRTEDITEELLKVEEGAVYVYKGGPSFATGNVTSQCNLLSLVKPCPADMAYAVFTGAEGGSRFGSKLATMRINKKTHLVISAPRSNKAGRLAGKVYLYTV